MSANRSSDAGVRMEGECNTPVNPLLVDDTFKAIALFAGVKVTVGVMTGVSRWHFGIVMQAPQHSRNWLDRLLKRSELHIPRSLRLICMDKHYQLKDLDSLVRFSQVGVQSGHQTNTDDDFAQRMTLNLNLSALISLVFDPRDSHVDLFERIEYEMTSLKRDGPSILAEAPHLQKDLLTVIGVIESLAQSESGLASRDLRRFVAARRSLEFDWSRLSRKMGRCESHLSHFVHFLEKYDSGDRRTFGVSLLRSVEQTEDDVEEVTWKLGKFARDRAQVASDLEYAKVELEMQQKKLAGLDRLLHRIVHAKDLLAFS